MTLVDTRAALEALKKDSMCENSGKVKSCPPFLKVKNENGGEDIHYSVVYDSLPPEFETVAARELKETPSAREEGLCKLREYMKRKDIPFLKEHLLLAILRNCKFDLKKSEVKLKNFHKTRTDFIKQLQTLEMERVKTIIDDMMFGMLPYRDKHGRIIFYTRPYAGNWDNGGANEVGIVYMIASLFILSFPLTTVSGIVYFGECKSNSLYIFYDIFKAFRKFVFPLLSLPVRLSRVEILNENYLCQTFWGFMKTILSKKIVERVSLHGSNFDQLFQMYNPDMLPEEFEGRMGPISNEAYREKFLDFIKDLRKQNP